MEKIPLPTTLNVIEGESPMASTIVIEPCYPGYGTTIGSSIRRHLLSSLQGVAVTALKIKSVLHEFSTMPNVKEDVIEIALNLKMLRLRVFGDNPVKLSLKVSGEKEVTAKDFEPNSDVEIINPDLRIATLTDKKAVIEMEVTATKGRGYLPTEAREKEELEPGVIAVDANFNPIEKIGFKVENVRVGHMTNWERLILDIVTDGTITPREAVGVAIQDLIDHFQFIAQHAKTETPKKTNEPEEKEKNEKEDTNDNDVKKKKKEKKS